MKKAIIIIIFIFINSCNQDNIKGKIEFRKDNILCDNADFSTTHTLSVEKENNGVYLVNTSIDKTFEFTIKSTITINNTSISYGTGKVKLAPEMKPD